MPATQTHFAVPYGQYAAKAAYRFALLNSRARWLLSLYNALRGSNYEDTSQLEITTLEDVIYISIKNDISFLINDEMYLFEHQSTVNPNMLKIENPLKKIVRQYNFLGLSRKQLGARLASDGH